MKKCLACLLALLFISPGAIAAQVRQRAARGEDRRESGRNSWLSSLDEAKAEARKTGLPLMVVIRCVP